jgi:CRP-like cAMP-binding protein
MSSVNEELLGQLPALEGAPPEVVAWLTANVERVDFEPFDRLVTQGDDDRDCYLLVEGDVEVRKQDGGRDTDHGGGITGELALLYGHPRSATATATTPVTALRLRAADFDELADTDPELAAATAEVIIEYLRFRFGFEPDGPWAPPKG